MPLWQVINYVYNKSKYQFCKLSKVIQFTNTLRKILTVKLVSYILIARIFCMERFQFIFVIIYREVSHECFIIANISENLYKHIFL